MAAVREAVEQRLAEIARRDLGADGTGHEAGADATRDRLKQLIGRDRPAPRLEQRRLEDERKKQRKLELERQRERDRDLG